MAKDVVMSYIENDLEKIKLKTNLYIQEYGDQMIDHLFREVAQNSIDELNDPDSNGSKIYITYDVATDIIMCEDDGRGFPEKDYPLDIFCTKIQSGSKFYRENGASSGEFGVGLTVVNALSDFFEITSYREQEGTKHIIRFENAEKVKDEFKKLTKTDKSHGSKISFKVSEKYAGEGSSFPYEKAIDWIDRNMYFPMYNKKIKIKFDVFDGMKLIDTHSFKAKEFKGLIERYVTDKSHSSIMNFGGDAKVQERINGEDVSKDLHLDIALTYASDITSHIYDSYCNFTNTTDGGVHQDTVEKVFCGYMQSKVKATLSDSQKEKLPITWDDIREGLICVINVSTSAQVRFEGNMKTKIGAPTLIKPIMYIMNKGLDDFFKENPSIFDNYAKIIKLNAKARIEAQAVKSAVQTEKMSTLKEHAFPGFTPCINTGNKYKELIIVEGNSAGGSARDGSDPYTVAILLLRGVIPNAFKKTLPEMMDNKEMNALVTVLRCGIGKNFDLSKLYFDRINIFTDEDSDGYNISSLILGFFYKYLPDIIKAGRLYKIFTPLYEINDKESPFVANKHEMVEIYHKKIMKNYKIKFNKDDEYISKDEMREFLEDTYDYRETLIEAGKAVGKTNKFLVEIAAAFLVISGVVRSEYDYDDFDEILSNQAFITRYMKNIQSKFPEITLKGDRLRGIIEGKYRLIKLSERFLAKTSDLLPIYAKYGLYVWVKNKNTDDKAIKLTIGEFLDQCMSMYPVILHRFKGLGEINADDLRNTALDINHRVSVQYTMSSAKNELEKMNIVHGKTQKDMSDRKEMMKRYKIRKEDLDN